MGVMDVLVEQCRKPIGVLGRVMTKTMNVMDAGLIKWAVERVECSKGKILDIGCGGGKTIYSLTKKDATNHIYGIDYSKDAVDLAIKKNQKEIINGRVSIYQGDVMNIPFESENFDYILAVRTHYFWNPLEKALSEVYRTLKQKGKFIILSEIYKIQYHMKEYNTEDSIKELLYQVGFKSVVIENRDKCICITASK